MKRGKRQKTRYLHWRIASLLGLDLGTTIGRLDPTTRPVVESVYQPKEGDELHRRFTVVDAYSAAVDLLDLKRGGVNVVFQAISAEELFYPDPSAAPAQYQGIWKDLFQGPEIVERVKQGIDEHLLFARRYSRYIEVAQSAAEVRRAVERGRIALVLMLKSGWINDDLTVLQQYHQWGIRVMALCHLAALNWADSSSVLNQKTGLSDFGRQVVRTCNELGMLVDLSHASDQTCWDALEVCSGPLIATHSKCRALSDSERDLPDELIKAIAATGGVVGILAPAPRPGRRAWTATAACGNSSPTPSTWPRPSSPTPKSGTPNWTWKTSTAPSIWRALTTWPCRRTSRTCPSGASLPAPCSNTATAKRTPKKSWAAMPCGYSNRPSAESDAVDCSASHPAKRKISLLQVAQHQQPS